MGATRGFTTVLIADDVDYGERGGVQPGGVKRFVEAEQGIWVDGPIPADAAYPEGAIVFSYQPTLVPAQITEVVKDGAFDGVIVAAKAVKPAKGKEKEFVHYAVRIGAGTNNVEPVPVKSNTPTWNSVATAESIVAKVIETCAPLTLQQQHQDVMAGNADSNDLTPNYTGQVEGKRVAVIGANGNIARKVIENLRPLVGKTGSIIGYSRSFTHEDAHNMWIEHAPTIEDAFRGADVVIVQVPLNDATKGMLTRELFELANRGMVYINSGRAGQEASLQDLEDLIRSGHIGGMALDFDYFPTEEPTSADKEPVNDSPLFPYVKLYERVLMEGAIKDTRRFLLTPHSDADTKGPAREAGAIQAVREILSYFREGVIINQVPLQGGPVETLDHVGPVKPGKVIEQLSDVKAHTVLLGAATTVVHALREGVKTPADVRKLLENLNTLAQKLPTGRAVGRG